MIHRLRVVVPGKLYRGSAPSPLEVSELKDKLGIRKIVSLDKATGDRIDKACKLLGIQHIKVYIDFSRATLIQALHHNLKELLIDGGPTYVHCHEGKDRTGLIVALFKCKYMGMDPHKALEEAKSLGFGIGVQSATKQLFEKLILSCGKEPKDQNAADIVSNERTYVGDNRDGALDEANRGSFSPYLDSSRTWPNDAVYNYINDQSPTRENYPDNGALQETHDFNERNVVPTMGVFDNDAGGRGFGPTENAGGFIYD